MSDYAEKIVNDPYYRRAAKDLTTLLFDKGFLADDLARDAIDWLEEYLAFEIGIRCETAVRAALLTKKLREHKALRMTKEVESVT